MTGKGEVVAKDRLANVCADHSNQGANCGNDPYQFSEPYFPGELLLSKGTTLILRFFKSS